MEKVKAVQSGMITLCLMTIILGLYNISRLFASNGSVFSFLLFACTCAAFVYSAYKYHIVMKEYEG